MARPQLSVYIAASLDGFIARQNGAIDWLSIVERPGVDYGYHRFFESIDTIVMGRKTYETALGFGSWPYEGKRCVVLTHGARVARHGETFFSGTITELAERLGIEGAKRAYVDGGSVISQFLSAGLIDDITLSIIPILLGDGIPLIHGIGKDVRLRLVKSQSFESGLVQLEYQPAHD
jgi:dihydrofolate reductase